MSVAQVPPIAPARPSAAAFVVPLAAAIVTRARFLSAPMAVDEGGYLAVARAWSRGAGLYDDVWVDRPQGLLVLYRLLHAVGLGTPVGVRLVAVAACALAALACGHVAARLVGERARLAAGLLVAVLAGLPQIEGHTANAELLSASLGAASLALCLEACHRGARRARWLLVAGAVGGAALTVKQSAFDALGAAFVAVVLVGLAGPRARQRALAGTWLVLGAALPVGLCMLHGALTGWDRWWFAVAGYRLSQRSALVDAHFERIGVVWEVVGPAAALLIVLAITGAAIGLMASPQSRRAVLVLGAWCALAVVAFVLGGQFFRHYWTILALPVATSAGAAVGAVGARAGRRALLIGALVGPSVLTVQALMLSRAEIGPTLHDDVRLVRSERVAQWFIDEARPGDRLYAMCVSAAVYGNADIDPPYPYLWWDGVRQIPGATHLLAELFERDDRPRFVAVFQTPASCDASGRVDQLVRQHYARHSVVDGVVILEERS